MKAALVIGSLPASISFFAMVSILLIAIRKMSVPSICARVSQSSSAGPFIV